jgi:SAM-dependent methyltransferase
MAEVRAGTNVDADDGTWRYAWPAGERMSAELGALVELRGRHVIDVGCGRGRLGLLALDLGAASATGADRSAEALAALPERPGLIRLRHHWGEALPICDVLLGGDILYRPAAFPELLDSIASAVAGGGIALLADPRQRLEPELPELAAARGLSWLPERRPTGYTLVRVAGLTGAEPPAPTG